MPLSFAAFKNHWRNVKIDVPLVLLLLILCAFGILILNSAFVDSSRLIYRQIVHIVVAFLVMLVIAQIPPYQLKRHSPALMFFGIFLLILVSLFGASSGGAARWLDIGILRFQPSELMKILVPLAIASILSAKTLPPRPLAVFSSVIIIAAVVFLIAKQPDLGTALLIGVSGFYVLFFSGIRIRIVRRPALNIALILTIIIGALFAAWHYLLKDYQKERIITLFNPELDPLGSGYHILQSKIAIGAGGLFGKGYGGGTQSQLSFLPEQPTDFIFAVLAEEFGFAGVLVLFVIYALVLYRAFLITMQCEDNFSRLLGAGFTMTFFTYIFVNVGMVSGILPVVGMPLPLMSYGGSSVVTLMAGFGIIMSLKKHKNPLYPP